MGLDADNMLVLAAALSDEWRVLLWDMPGHGASSIATDYSMSMFVDALETVIKAAGATQPVLLGFSFGGIIAQYALAKQPATYKALIAYGCFAPFHQPPPIPRAMISAALLPYRIRSWARMKYDFADLCAESEAGRADVTRALERTSKPVFIAMTRTLLESFEAQPSLRFDCPLLVVRGSHDSNRALLEKSAAGLIAAHPDAGEVVVENAGHCAHNDRTDEVAAVLREFLLAV
jgi:pimeloyl-ACP methyl ester carboxylesterase